ncbi:MAG: ABC transporter ATP-binding protein/permease, partial [Bacteroidetes bacterium]|nr:ABC transporter ATP-binding protein/permease [Bacteroidota bacterium]
LFSNSEELSIGEWQKLALARAFYRDSPIIILDEPTSSLDAQAEEDIIHRFLELTRNKTTVIISHRFSTVRNADYIYFMEAGKVAEEGAHEDMMARNGEYARLYRMQAGHYQ